MTSVAVLALRSFSVGVPERLPVICSWAWDPTLDFDMDLQVPSEEVFRNMALQTTADLCRKKSEVSYEEFTQCLQLFFGWCRKKHPCMRYVRKHVHFNRLRQEIRLNADSCAEKRRCWQDRQFCTFADTVNYSYARGGSVQFALQMWRNDFDY